MTEVAVALIWEGGKFMICQRPARMFSGLSIVGFQFSPPRGGRPGPRPARYTKRCYFNSRPAWGASAHSHESEPQFSFNLHGCVPVGCHGIDLARVFGYENRYKSAAGNGAVAVAASCRLNDGLQRRKGAVHGRKIQINAGLYALSCHDTAGEAFGEPLFYGINDLAPMLGAEIRGQENRLSRLLSGQAALSASNSRTA